MQVVPTDSYGSETLMIEIKNKWYVVHPDYIDTTAEGKGSIEWSPDPISSADGPKADYLTSYTVSLRFVPQNNIIKVREDGKAFYEDMIATFIYAENLVVTMNEDKASFDKGSNTLSYTFPMTKDTLVKVYQPEDVAGIPYGTSGDALKTYMPLVKILTDSGRAMEAAAVWGDSQNAVDLLDKYSMRIWKTSGTVELPYGVDNSNEVSLGVVSRLSVDSAESVDKAVPSVDRGEYRNDQRVSLSCETEGAHIEWATDPEATDNINNVEVDPKWFEYEEGNEKGKAAEEQDKVLRTNTYIQEIRRSQVLFEMV